MGLGTWFGSRFRQIIVCCSIEIYGSESRHCFNFSMVECLYYSSQSECRLCDHSLVRLYTLASLQLASFDERKESWRKKGTLPLGLQTFLGLGLLAMAYCIALTVEKPVAAILNFFIGVLVVVLATYLLFNAGTITLLQFLKKKKKILLQNAEFYFGF